MVRYYTGIRQDDRCLNVVTGEKFIAKAPLVDDQGKRWVLVLGSAEKHRYEQVQVTYRVRCF